MIYIYIYIEREREREREEGEKERHKMDGNSKHLSFVCFHQSNIKKISIFIGLGKRHY